MKRVTASLVLLLIASPALAQEPVQEREHVVKQGDTLWDLAGYYFSDPWTWPTIYQANTSVVEDPHWIYPQEVLVIPGLQGETGQAAMEPAPREATRVAVRPADPQARTVFYRRPPPPPQSEQPTVLSEPVRERVPVRPGEFNSAPFVTHPDNLEVVGRFIRSLRENRDVGGAPTAHPQELVFLGYTEERRPEVGDRLLLVRVRGSVPGTPAGSRMIEPRAMLQVTGLEAEVVQARIESQYGPVHIGDVAIPVPFYPDFDVEEAAPVAGGSDLEGRVLDFVGDPPLPSRANRGFVNLGSRDGVRVGDLFTAYLPERRAREREAGEFRSYIEQLPPENVAVLRVIRVTDDVSTVLVDRLMLPRLEDGIRVRRTHAIQ